MIYRNTTNLANEYNKYLTNVGKAPVPCSIPSRHHYDRNESNKFTFTEIPFDEIVDELNAIFQNKASGLDVIR